MWTSSCPRRRKSTSKPARASRCRHAAIVGVGSKWVTLGSISSPATVVAVHVVDRLAGNEPRDPVDELLPVDLQFVERRPFEDAVAVAGRRVAVQDDPGLL